MRTLITPFWSNRGFASHFMHGMEEYNENTFSPACEVSESENNYLMSLDLPGMKIENIKIEVADDILTVSGERSREKSSEDQGKLQRFEKSYGFFKRSFQLPTTIDGSKVEARYQDGVLEVALPKTEKAKPRTIEVQKGKIN